jgi:NADPH:quinone reductase-like Zn-dependent oxidoreductase
MAIPYAYQAWQKTPSFQQLAWDSPSLASNLSLETLQAPDIASLAPHTALIRILGAALNFRDLLTIAHSPVYPVPLEIGNAPGSDGAGEVIATSPNSHWKIGDRVILAPNTWREGRDQRDFYFESTLGATVQGTLRQLAVVGDEGLVSAPKGLTFEEAATLPTAGVTAFRALFGEVDRQRDRVREGEWVLTQGTGGVSLWAVQVSCLVMMIMLLRLPWLKKGRVVDCGCGWCEGYCDVFLRCKVGGCPKPRRDAHNQFQNASRMA